MNAIIQQTNHNAVIRRQYRCVRKSNTGKGSVSCYLTSAATPSVIKSFEKQGFTVTRL